MPRELRGHSVYRGDVLNVCALTSPSESATVLDELGQWADEIRFAYAWASSGEGNAVHWRAVPLDRIRRAVIGCAFAQTEPYILYQLHAQRILRVADSEGVFHPKLLVATKGAEARILVGSSNFTVGGFTRNTEVNVVLSGAVDHPTIAKLLAFVDEQWIRAIEPDGPWLAKYESDYAARPAPPIVKAPRGIVEAGRGDHGGDVTEFHDAEGKSLHDAFQMWRLTHPTGYFLKFDTRTRARLHSSLCVHSGDPTWTTDDYDKSLTKSRKVCSNDTERLYDWAQANGIEVVRCAHC